MLVDSGRAHRALDDCVSLASVAHIMAESVDLPVSRLLMHFAVELDLQSGLAQISVLLEIVHAHRRF